MRNRLISILTAAALLMPGIPVTAEDAETVSQSGDYEIEEIEPEDAGEIIDAELPYDTEVEKPELQTAEEETSDEAEDMIGDVTEEYNGVPYDIQEPEEAEKTAEAEDGRDTEENKDDMAPEREEERIKYSIEDDGEAAEYLREIEELENMREEAPEPKEQNDVYYYPDETEEEENYTPEVNTEVLPHDAVLPDEYDEHYEYDADYETVNGFNGRKKAPRRAAAANSVGDIWKQYFNQQFGDDYLKPYIRKEDGQTVTGSTNRLVVEETDLRLRGKNGLDVVLSRKHDNQEYNIVYGVRKGASDDKTFQEKYLVTFRNTSTNEKINIAFYNEDEFYTYMYNGSRLTSLAGVKMTTYNIKTVDEQYTYYNFADIFSKMTTNTSYDFYEYDSASPCISFTEQNGTGNSVYLESRRLLAGKHNIGFGWKFLLPEAYMYRYSSVKTNYNNASTYDWNFVGAFRDISGNIIYFDGYEDYTIPKNTSKERTCISSWYPDNNYLSISKSYAGDTLSDGKKYNMRITDNRGYIYYLYCPSVSNTETPGPGQSFYIVAVEDFYGNRISYAYDSSYSRLEKITDTYGRDINFTYGSNNITVTYFNPDLNKNCTVKYELSTLSGSALNNDSAL